VDFIVLPGMVKLYSMPHRYPVSLSKITKFFILPILQSLLTYNWELTSTNCVIIGLTLKEKGSFSKVSKVATLQEVIRRFC